MAQTLGTALITGASSGIGEIYADRLAKRGYDLVLVGRNEGKLTALAADLAAKAKVRVTPLIADLGNIDELATVETVVANDPALTLLVNSAGVIAGGPLSAGNLEALDNMLAVNVTALTRLSAVAAKAFSTRGKGAIVNIASAMAYIDSPVAAAYAASKAYVLNLTLSLELDVKPKGVAVQAVLPGYTRTAMIASQTDIPETMIMSAEELVDAALAGLDAGELVTIPSLESTTLYDDWVTRRLALRPHLSLSKPATRYTQAASAA